MAAATLPWMSPSLRWSQSVQSGCTMLSTCLSYRPRFHPGRFAVSAVLCSSSQVNQSAKFVDASKHGNLTPLYQCIYADQLTPVLAYRCLVNEDDHETPSFLFESVEFEADTPTVGRYSVIGANPAMEIIAMENSVTIMNHLEGWRTQEHSDEPMMIAQRITEKFNPRQMDDLPEVFCGGWVGYFSYDTVRYGEKRLTFSNAPVDDRNLPDVYLGLYDDVLVFDHIEKKIYVIHWVQLDRFSSTEEAIENGMNRLQSLLSKVYDIVNPRLSAGSIECDGHKRRFKGEILSRDSSETYEKAIYTAKEHIMTGDIQQLSLSQRFERRTFSDPFEVYRTLSIANPSPFMAYLQVRGSVLVASSHETLTHVEPKRKIVNGTHNGRVNGAGRLEKGVLGKQVFNGVKHYNGQTVFADLAKTVRKVTDVGSTWWNTLQTALPPESVTGAPKIKAIELIDELEVNRRGLYGGGIGSISFSGNMDIALSPRTIVFPTGNNFDTLLSYKNPKNRREWVAHIQAGASIVADSDPRDVAQECQSEAHVVARAIDLAESSFLDKISYDS
ncbi:anthranilate synthase alpha subunit 2, chloroplastic-like [Silene latifolia]|uniref:anthranilate synthase alpha subunit 2, chloroplastic-like n=1 Tax=Silene latifolia TaxID=37657 RepID=UPI003D7812D5